MTRHTPTELREMARICESSDYELDVAASMLRQAADDAEDAERYRWIRSSNADRIQNGGTHLEVFADNGFEGKWVGSDLDEVVDAARKETT